MSPLTHKQIAYLKQSMMEERAQLHMQLEKNNHFDLSSSQRDSTGELSMIDNHPADTATELYERGKDIALNERAEKQLQELDLALERINDHNYGYCVTCKQEISYERLQALPATLYCKNHTPEQHVSQDRPIEEEFLNPPFGRTDKDDDDYTGFDGEDAWQILESWGNSNSPAMAEDPNVDDYNDMYIEADEPNSYVDPIESFLASDLFGNDYALIRNEHYKKYMEDLDAYDEAQSLGDNPNLDLSYL